MCESYTILEKHGIAKNSHISKLGSVSVWMEFDNALCNVYIRCIHHEDFMIRTQVYITEQEKTVFREKWDGVYKGNLVPTDVYVYKVRAKDVFDEWHDYIGKVTVIK